MQYKLNRLYERFGNITLSLETLADISKEIDALCANIKSPEQAKKAEELCPYFGVIWPSARALAEYFAEMGTALRGKTVLEVGCGLGVPSIVAAKLGAFVTATDFHPDVQEFLTRNCKINQVRIDFHQFDWRNVESGLGTFDYVVGSDILYEEESTQKAMEALLSHCNKNSHIIIADPGRPLFQQCAKDLKTKGFKENSHLKLVTEEPTAPDAKELEILISNFQKAA